MQVPGALAAEFALVFATLDLATRRTQPPPKDGTRCSVCERARRSLFEEKRGTRKKGACIGVSRRARRFAPLLERRRYPQLCVAALKKRVGTRSKREDGFCFCFVLEKGNKKIELETRYRARRRRICTCVGF